MQIPEKVKTYKSRSSVFWFDEDGIVYSTPREDAPPTISDEEIKERADQLWELSGEKKVCLVLELNKKQAGPSRQQRALIQKQFERVLNALAIVATSPVTKMIANIFFTIKPAGFPVKMFTDEGEAKKWAKGMCETLNKKPSYSPAEKI